MMAFEIIKNKNEKILRREFASSEIAELISIENVNNATEFTISVIDVNHLKYKYDPYLKKFEIQFLSIRQEEHSN